MSARRQELIALAAAAVVGCSVGPRPETYRPAIDPTGTTCSIRVQGSGQLLVGELLAARSADAVLVVNHKLWVIPYQRIRASNCEHAGPIPFEDGRLIETLAADIRLKARYPQGINDDLLARLLAAYGQSAPMAPQVTP
jgi:hypothetical protein